MLAADASFDRRIHKAQVGDRHPHEFADTIAIDGDEGICFE